MDIPDDFPVNHNLQDLVTPLNIPVIMQWLDIYLTHNPELHEEVSILKSGFTDGFILYTDNDLKPWQFKNHRSARVMPHHVLKILAKEVGAGRIAGPFDQQPIPSLRTHSLGLVPKPNQAWRYIYDHSMTDDTGASVNNRVPDNRRKVQYTMFDEVIEKIVQMGYDTQLFKTDVKSAFRLLPLHKSMYRLTGIYFAKKWFIDKTLVMGASSSCYLFELFSTFLNWVMVKVTKNDGLWHYLDDYLGGDPPHPQVPPLLAQEHFDGVKEVASDLGVPLHPDKCEGPTTRLEFLGMGIDTQLMVVYAPLDKVIRALTLINYILQCTYVKVKILSSALGLCAFLTKAIPNGRAFLQRPYRLLRGKKQSDKTSIGDQAKQDLLKWREFLSIYNGKTMMVQDDGSKGASFGFWTDASTSWGIAGMLESTKQYFAIEWPEDMKNNIVSTCLAEIVPIVLAFNVPQWASLFYDRMVIVYCDNQSAVSCINKGTSKVPCIAEWLRPLSLRLMHLNIRLKAVYVNTTIQKSDLISRGLFSQFFQKEGQYSRVHPLFNGLPSIRRLKVCRV